jgi:hypothetical protein
MTLTKVADVTDDQSNKMLYKFSRLIDFPKFVKEAEAIEPAEVATLPQQVFADPTARKFPCHTKAATWLSQLYFLEAQHNYPTLRAQEVQGRINKAAAYFAIEDTTKEAAELWEQHNTPEQIVDDKDYAMIFEQDGKTVRHLPINNEVNIKAAAQKLFEKQARYPFDLRQIAARKILHNATEHKAQLDDTVEEYLYKAAGFGMTTPARAAEKLGMRALMMPKEAGDMRTKMAKLTKSVLAMKEIPLPELTKLAEIVDRVDTEFGFYQHYNDGIDTPEEIFFELTEKRASALKNEYIQLTTGTLLPVDMIHALPIAKIATTVGADFLKAIISDSNLDIDIEKFARVAPTLPRDDALLLERAIQSAGASIKQPTFADIVS